MTRRGLTLIEMVFALIILGVIAGGLFATSLLSQRSYDSTGAYVQVQQQARWAFDRMVNELRQAGQIPPCVNCQRLDFQLARSYDPVACAATGGICWGTDDPNFSTGWLHYVLDTTTDPANPRYMRCATAAAAGDAMPAGFVGCRVLANNVDTTPANTSFSLAGAVVTVRLRITVVSLQLPGGSMATSMSSRVRLRNL